MVLNKVDAVADRSFVDVLRALYPAAVPTSARNRTGLAELERRVTDELAREFVDVEISTSAGNGKLLAYLQSHAIEHSRIYEDGRVKVQCRLRQENLGQVIGLQGQCRALSPCPPIPELQPWSHSATPSGA
jgi:GTP-binding protein HflX